MVECLNGGTTGSTAWGAGPWGPAGVVPPQQAEGGAGRDWRPRFLPAGSPGGSVPAGRAAGSMGRARGRRGRSGPAPTQCANTQCFDPLVRGCVACRLFRTPEPRPASPPSDPRLLPARPSPLSVPFPPSPAPPLAAEPSSRAPGTAVQPQEAGGAGAGAEALPLPALLLGAPALLGLALALVLVAALGWRRLRRPAPPKPPKAPDTELDEPLDNVIILSSGPLDATAPVWPPPGENPATTPPAHSVPVPATELGSTELVTTKTAGPEQQ
uniref:TNF receptor superfamily member 13C n=1 Tax=Myotis myotis TaxID=51298 RepID=A0A7J7ZA55_MYOMY|nr:TNF receptor superfamily member 13C [Myotis myotis]